MEVTFYLKYATRFGEGVFVSGDFESEGVALVYALQYYNREYWVATIDITNMAATYEYFIKENNLLTNAEPGGAHTLIPAIGAALRLTLMDTWIDGACAGRLYNTAPFKILLTQNAVPESIKYGKINFIVQAPLLPAGEVLGMIGNTSALGNWDVNRISRLQQYGNIWHIAFDNIAVDTPLQYKYITCNPRQQRVTAYEAGENRTAFFTPENLPVVVNDVFFRPVVNWRGAGMAIPVFSLRSGQGSGCGEFNDLKLMADWAVLSGIKMIQLLPVNDTTATRTWIDSYPYAAVSAFALHPIYLNIKMLGDSIYETIKTQYEATAHCLNALPQLDYEAVLHLKLNTARQLFENGGKHILNDENYKNFYKNNKAWLQPYATFCYLRDRFNTADFSQWEAYSIFSVSNMDALWQTPEALPHLHFHCYLQYHLSTQLQAAVSYAHSKGVVLKGDLPIGIYKHSIDAWVQPELYHMDRQAGAPPDAFAVNGQNWGFPTYNWPQMKKDNYNWWKQRFDNMSLYFDAFRIDHILGFFRIWSIPDTAVQGILGHFEPAIPVTSAEIITAGIGFDEARFCQPYITAELLERTFGARFNDIVAIFFLQESDGIYLFKEEFNTQQKVSAYFNDTKNNTLPVSVQEAVLSLLANVILLPAGDGAYHFRIDMDKTYSFQCLTKEEQNALLALYYDYFYHRQEELWRNEALQKLTPLLAATNMLVCGEDLGMVPACVPGVMKQLGILSLEVQRMPKQSGTIFFNPANAPYTAVVTPGTHDMSTLRGWWQEDSKLTQYFYNEQLQQTGTAPAACNKEIVAKIIQQHLQSPAMWSIFQVQDILALSDSYTVQAPDDERINIPANPHHYWRYRMPVTIETLIADTGFNNALRQMITEAGR